MRKAIRPSAPSAPRSSASALAMLRDPRVLHSYPGHTVFKQIPAPQIEIPLTVVVTVDNVDLLPHALRSLVIQDYASFRIIVACISPKHRDRVEGLVARYQKFLPSTILFSLKSAGWPADALNGVLPIIQTKYWSWMNSADILHPRALAATANAILAGEADYYSTLRYELQSNDIVRPLACPVDLSNDAFWSGVVFPYDRLITYRMSAVARVGGFVSYDRYPGDTVWIMAYKMKAAGLEFRHIPAVVYFERMHQPGDKITTPVEYRRALLLQHWPSLYVEETDEEAVGQMLDRIDEEEGRGSKTTD